MKHRFANRLFRFIMKIKNTAIYKLIYNHPRLFILILVVAGILILYYFINFIFSYVVVL